MDGAGDPKAASNFDPAVAIFSVNMPAHSRTITPKANLFQGVFTRGLLPTRPHYKPRIRVRLHAQFFLDQSVAHSSIWRYTTCCKEIYGIVARHRACAAHPA